MNIVLSIGLLIFTGFIFGEFAKKAKLPKISGYILAGIILNPDLFGIMSAKFVEHTDPLLTVALSIITFSIGGSLSFSKIKSNGKTILFLTLYESLAAFLFVFIFMFISLYFFINIFNSVYVIIAVSLLMAALAAPTDPSATIAVIHEYKAKGIVSSSMLEIAAFDDVVGIAIFTIGSAFARSLAGDTGLEFGRIMIELGSGIGGALILGIIVGLAFNFFVKIFKNQTEGSLIVLTIGMVLLCYGISDFFGFESLIATMVLGAVVINFNSLSDKIFKLIERYTDELIFVIFFSLSGLHLQLSAITGSFALILIFIIARAIGKYSGIYVGAIQLKTNQKVKKYAAGGLIPQGGIVIGLALMLTKEPAYEKFSSVIIGIVIGAALIHELFGPVLSRISLKKADEID